jgi:type II secretory pathway pseudopilin PulG
VYPTPFALRSAGFTLLEILVALFVMALLGAMLGAIVVAAVANQKKAEATLLRERIGSQVLDLFARDIAQVYAYDLPGSFEGKDESGPSGEADSVSFVTGREPSTLADDPEAQQQEQRQASAPSPRGAAIATEGAEPDPDAGRRPFRLTKVAYFLRPSASHPGLMTLFRSEQKFIPPPPPDPNAAGGRTAAPAAGAFSQANAPLHTFEVFDRVKSFKLEYLSKKEGVRDGWTAQDEIPKAVRATLEIVPDPAAEAEAGPYERPRRVYQSVISLETSIPEPPQQQGRPAESGRPM